MMTMTFLAEASRLPLWVILAYLASLLVLGVVSGAFFRGTSADYFVASRSIGPIMLLMSVFGTTMTAFAMVGSTAEAYDKGIGVYGLMASWSGLVHSAVFFLVGIRCWAIGKRYGYVTQCQFFRDRFESPFLGYLLFPILVMLVIPYLLIGLLGAGATVRALSIGMFPETFTAGAIPQWLTGLVISGVVLTYVFYGGVRSTAWANTFQTIVFMATGLLAFWMIARAIGREHIGPTGQPLGVLEAIRGASKLTAEKAHGHLVREGMIGQLQFLSYMFVPLSVGMFPHLFQHWLTARSAKTFRLTVVAHPIFIMIVWLPCILIGIWAAGYGLTAPGGNSNAILGKMVKDLVHSDFLSGLLTAGVLAAIMSSLDSQFMCLGTMFTNDIAARLYRGGDLTDRQKLMLGRAFVLSIVVVTYLLSLLNPPHIFALGVWCFSGFGALFPLVFAAVYWKRVTKAGAIACVAVTAVVWIVLFTRDMMLRAGDNGEELLIYGMMPAAIMFLCSASALTFVSLLTRPPSPETVDKFVLVRRG